MQRSRFLLVIIPAVLGTGVAHADFTADLAQEYRDKDYIRGAVVENLVKLNIGKGCQEKVLDVKTNQAMTLIGRGADNMVAIAKSLTGDDWKEMSKSSANTPEENRKAVESKIAAAKTKLSITVNVEGSTCAVDQGGHWIKYFKYTTDALMKTPPKAGKAIVKINATSKAKDFTVKAGKDGSFEITGPLDKEVTGWADKLETQIARAAK